MTGGLWLPDLSFTCSIAGSLSSLLLSSSFSPSPSHYLPTPTPSSSHPRLCCHGSKTWQWERDRERGRERERERVSKCHLSHLIHNLWVCVCVCMKMNMLDMFVYISVYLLRVSGVCVCVCVCACGAWVSKWESCVELVHRFITELRQCEGKHSTFVCLTAYSSTVSVFSFWCSL